MMCFHGHLCVTSLIQPRALGPAEPQGLTFPVSPLSGQPWFQPALSQERDTTALFTSVCIRDISIFPTLSDNAH